MLLNTHCTFFLFFRMEKIIITQINPIILYEIKKCHHQVQRKIWEIYGRWGNIIIPLPSSNKFMFFSNFIFSLVFCLLKILFIYIGRYRINRTISKLLAIENLTFFFLDAFSSSHVYLFLLLYLRIDKNICWNNTAEAEKWEYLCKYLTAFP